MNNKKNYSWRKKNRNQSSADRFDSTRTAIDSTHELTSRFTSLRMADPSEREKQEFQYEEEGNIHIRSFCEGRESETEMEQFQSLHDQRTYANRQNQQRGRMNQRRNNRGYSRSRRSNFNRSQSRSSDTESVSSCDSHTQFTQSHINFNSLNKNPAYSNSVLETPEVNFSFSNKNPTYSHSISDSPELFSHKFNAQKALDVPADPVNEISSEDFGSAFNSQNIKQNNFDNCPKNNSYFDTNNDITNPNAKSSRHKLNEYKNYLKNLDPAHVIMECRQQVEDDAKDSIVMCLKKINEISSQHHSSMLKLHLENLLQQQLQFEDYIAKVKGQLSLLFSSNIQDLLENCEKIEKNVKKECNIFKRSLPAYAYKGALLKRIQENRVTIISSDSAYFLNILLPIFVKSEFSDHYLVCSEPCRVLAENLRKNVFQLLYDKIETDEIDEIKFKNEMNFVTVDEMLNLFVDDYTFKEKKIFAILNLSLKRSLNQDIVLSYLKDILQENEHLRIVLMTTFIDNVYKYEKYFSNKINVTTFKMPSLTLPVKTVWKNTALQPTDDYVSEIARTVLAIHTLNDFGDVMAFLPTSADTKSASIQINNKLCDLQFDDLKCEVLNENSPQKSCLELFNKRPSDKRTVFLVTECGEMLVVPSIRYIVDCGLRKEYIFDDDKKIDVLSTTFISCSKSKLRKSLAGSFSTGICYRLYSKEDYLEMPHNEYPEILTINPFNSMIKIFQYRPDTATTVEFVESLPESTKESALELLKKYNAIKDNTLTDLGKNIVKLPFPAKYSKLILLGIHWGLAYEAVILVAFFSVKGRVFQFSTDIDRQREIDAVKLSLVQYDSDTLSYLYIYKMWLDSKCSEAWCDKHYINYNTLKNVHAKVNEICQIVGESLKENINQEFVNTGKSSATSLLEMLFDCFLENLCVFTGHYRSGYRVLSSHCIAFLHPSSIICQMENLPQFIIFDHMVCTNREFLMSITSIPPDFITKAMVEQQIDFDYSDMFEKSLVPRVIEPVGERLIKQVLLGKKGKKLKAIEAHIKSLLSTDSLVIEPIAEKGQVLIYALKDQIDEAFKLVDDVLKRQFQDLVNLEQVHTLEMKRGQILIPIEIKWLRGGQVASVKIGKNSQGLVNNASETDAEENPPDQQPCVVQQSINVTWIRRPCNGKGFVTFRNEDFMKARKLTMKSFNMLDSDIFVQVSRNEKNQLYITGISKEAKPSDLETFFSNLLPDVKPVKIELKYSAPFETSEAELEDIQNSIEEICYKYSKLSNFEVVVPLPKPTATVMKAFINVKNEEDIELAIENLSKCPIGNAKLVCKPVYRSVIKCSLKICEALKPRFQKTLTELQNKLKEKFEYDELFEFVVNQASDDLAVIKMLSNKQEILLMLQRVINQLLEGEVLNRSFSFKLNKIFCHGGHMWLGSLEKTSKVLIIEDYNNKTLRLYGTKENCHNCKQRILQFLEDSENEAVAVIHLSGKRKLLKEIIKKYGANLEKFIESCELQTAVLDIKSCSISLHGSQDSIEKAEECLNKLASGLHASDSSEVISSAEKCPLCLCPAFNLTFRLELCGHLYCSECIEGLIDQAEFPLRCCSEDCCHDIVLDDICKVLGDDPVKIKVLLEKSMKYYLERHADDIIHCPAPDCSMFFFKNEIVGDKHNCPLCQNDICIKCNVVYHQGFTCDMYQGSKNDPDYSFKVWQKTAVECKRCPKCNTAIEKNGGCDHMTCHTCRSHFCWVCVREFPDAAAVYRHIPFCDRYPR
ncbi:uncharacterized protein LOC129971350 [Argiope bruennichi]|uniref:ATP-dependent RNA helicase DHX8 like protein n=1 Tax=Argiope bruennichi TaxID=94029 RepID=A0A8T0F9H6_ARGBR|nr:uncharacterized protein LOC129971350 [Argiope bruennichi]KAF8786845.1 ATP-dependent RNA helicase DHX8 like protein [Argiope bruennichi]